MNAPIASLTARLADPHVQTWVELRFAPRALTAAELIAGIRNRCEARIRDVLASIDTWVEHGLVTAIGCGRRCAC